MSSIDRRKKMPNSRKNDRECFPVKICMLPEGKHASENASRGNISVEQENLVERKDTTLASSYDRNSMPYRFKKRLQNQELKKYWRFWFFLNWRGLLTLIVKSKWRQWYNRREFKMILATRITDYYLDKSSEPLTILILWVLTTLFWFLSLILYLSCDYCKPYSDCSSVTKRTNRFTNLFTFVHIFQMIG